jgi:hypothetical protein
MEHCRACVALHARKQQIDGINAQITFLLRHLGFKSLGLSMLGKLAEDAASSCIFRRFQFLITVQLDVLRKGTRRCWLTVHT